MITFSFVSLYSENLGIVKRPLANILLVGPFKKMVFDIELKQAKEISIFRERKC